MLFAVLIITSIHGSVHRSKSLNFQNIPVDVLGNIATYIHRENDQHSFSVLSKSCNIVMRPHRSKRRQQMEELYYQIYHITPRSLTAHWWDIHKIAAELIDIAHPQIFQRMSQFITVIEQSTLSTLDKCDLYKALNLNQNRDLVSRLDHISGNITDEIRLLIVSSSGIFHALREDATLDFGDGGYVPAHNQLSFRFWYRFHCTERKMLFSRCSLPCSVEAAVLYQRLIPYYHALSADDQYDLVIKHQFIPWPEHTVESIKQQHTGCFPRHTDKDPCFIDIVSAAKRFTIRNDHIVDIYTEIKTPEQRLHDTLMKQQNEWKERDQKMERRYKKYVWTAMIVSWTITGIIVIIVSIN